MPEPWSYVSINADRQPTKCHSTSTNVQIGDRLISSFYHKLWARMPFRVGAGVAGMAGGGACAALVAMGKDAIPRRGGGCWDDGWGRLRRPGGSNALCHSRFVTEPYLWLVITFRLVVNIDS